MHAEIADGGDIFERDVTDGHGLPDSRDDALACIETLNDQSRRNRYAGNVSAEAFNTAPS